jgi:hypothetical protein
MHLRTLLATATVAAAFAWCAAPAHAESVSVEGGFFTGRAGGSGGGAVSLGLFGVPATPVHTELTVAAAGRGGAAGTVDVRAGGATQIGAGIGIGSLGNTATTTVVYDALVSQSIAPHVALTGRLYFGPQRSSTLFAGLRLSL